MNSSIMRKTTQVTVFVCETYISKMLRYMSVCLLYAGLRQILVVCEAQLANLPVIKRGWKRMFFREKGSFCNVCEKEGGCERKAINDSKIT